MKFVTVMDMWLLIINLGLMGTIVYFGRKLVKSFSRIAVVAEKRIDSPERARILKIVQEEINTYELAVSLGDEESFHTLKVLKDIEKQIIGER